MALVSIVDEDDEVIGSKEREQLAPNDINRAAVLFIANSQGDILLAQRSLTKKKNPGKWGMIGGTVEVGEGYDSNIVKEAKEELGVLLSLGELEWGPKWRTNSPPSNHFAQSFRCVVDKPAEQFIFDHGELSEVRWFPREEVLNMVEENSEELSVSARVGLSKLLM